MTMLVTIDFTEFIRIVLHCVCRFDDSNHRSRRSHYRLCRSRQHLL